MLPFDLSALLFALLGGGVLFQLLLRRDLFSPDFVYFFVFLLTLGISYLKLNPAMTDLKTLTWIVLIGSFLAFLSGTISAKLYFLSKGFTPRSLVDRSQSLVELYLQYNWKRQLWLIVFFSIPIALSWIILYSKLGTFTVAFSDVHKLMSARGIDIGMIGFFLGLYTIIPLLLLPLTFKSFNTNWTRWLARFVSLIVIVIGFSMYPARNPLMIFLVFVAAFYNFAVKPFRVKAAIIGLIVVLFVFVIGMLAKRQVETLENNVDTVWQYPYSYIANNYWNLDYAVNEPTDLEIHPQTWGHVFWGGILLLNFWPDWQNIGKAFQWDDQFNGRIEKVHGLNTAGYWWNIYKDFGLLGVFLFPFFGGALIGWLFYRFRYNPTIPMLMTLSFLMHLIVFLFFVDFWSLVTTTLSFIAVLLSVLLCTPTNRKALQF